MENERTRRIRRDRPGPSSGEAPQPRQGDLLQQVRAFDDIGAWVNAETAVGDDAAEELRRRVNQSGE